MMRETERELSDVATRFRRESAWVTATSLHADSADGLTAIHAIRVQANAERAVELLYRLSRHLDPLVDVALAHVRDSQTWEGALVPLSDVRDVIGRLRWPLAMFGGVELSLYTGADQLTLTPQLELVLYSRDSRWPKLLEAEGVSLSAAPLRQVWNATASVRSAAPDLSYALMQAIERLQPHVAVGGRAPTTASASTIADTSTGTPALEPL